MLTVLVILAQLSTPIAPLTHLEVRGSTIGVASKSDAWVSTDGGATFRRVLAGPKPIDAIAATPAGLFVVRGDQVAFHDAQSAKPWRRLPQYPNSKFETLVAVEGWLVHVSHASTKAKSEGPSRVHISKDQGRTWKRILSRPKVRPDLRESFGYTGDIFVTVGRDGLIMAEATSGTVNVRNIGRAFWHVAGRRPPNLDLLTIKGTPLDYDWATDGGWVVGTCFTDRKKSYRCAIDPKGKPHAIPRGGDFSVRASPNGRWLWAMGVLVDTTANFKAIKTPAGARLVNLTDQRLWLLGCQQGRCPRGAPSQILEFDLRSATLTPLGPWPRSSNWHVTRTGQAWALVDKRLMRLRDKRWVPVTLNP